MDAIKLIKADHRKVEQLFKEFEGLGERATKSKQKIADQICLELQLHAHIEEQVFYPVLREKCQAEEIVLEGYEEHETVKFVIEELQGIGPDHERFDVRVKVLKELVEHHVEEEEETMLPLAEKLLGKDVLIELGQQMEALKAKGLPDANLRVTMMKEMPVEDRANL